MLLAAIWPVLVSQHGIDRDLQSGISGLQSAGIFVLETFGRFPFAGQGNKFEIFARFNAW